LDSLTFRWAVLIIASHIITHKGHGMKTFTTVASMKLAHVNTGQLVKTQGYHTAGDGGGATYLIASPQAVDGVSDHVIANSDGRVALLQEEGELDLRQFGAKLDGVTDDTAAINAMKAKEDWYFVPEGSGTGKSASLLYNQTGAFHTGPGKLETTEGERANTVINISSAPSSWTTPNGILTEFTAEMKSPLNYQSSVTGAATIGQPTNGYFQQHEVVPVYHRAYFSSGYNNSNTDNDGRTGWHMQRHSLSHYGHGDAGCYNANVFMANTDPTITGIMGQPAGILFNGQITAGVHNVYFNPYEVLLRDKGFDVQAIGLVTNFDRTNSTAGLDQTWAGIRMQSIGTAEADSAYQVVGNWKNGLDCTTAASSLVRAVVLAADQEIHFDGVVSTQTVNPAFKRYASTSGGTKMGYIASGSTLQVSVEGAINIQMNPTSTVFKRFTSCDSAINTAAHFQVDNVQVVTNTQTGWAAPTGTADRTTFATGSVTLSELAERVKALIDDLTTHGLIGT
jgi:hypothetical protein